MRIVSGEFHHTLRRWTEWIRKVDDLSEQSLMPIATSTEVQVGHKYVSPNNNRYLVWKDYKTMDLSIKRVKLIDHED